QCQSNEVPAAGPADPSRRRRYPSRTMVQGRVAIGRSSPAPDTDSPFFAARDSSSSGPGCPAARGAAAHDTGYEAFLPEPFARAAGSGADSTAAASVLSASPPLVSATGATASAPGSSRAASSSAAGGASATASSAGGASTAASSAGG